MYTSSSRAYIERGIDLTHLLMAGLVRVTGFAEVGDEIENGLSDAHVLAREVLRKVGHSHDKRLAKDVRQVFAADAAKTLRRGERERDI